ncbi:MAG: PDZ domain-containing protein [Pirellulales bacterium]
MMFRFASGSILFGLMAVLAAPASGQTARQEGRLDARAERQEGRFEADRVEGRLDARAERQEGRSQARTYGNLEGEAFDDDRFEADRSDAWQGDFDDDRLYTERYYRGRDDAWQDRAIDRDDYRDDYRDDMGREATLGVTLDSQYRGGARVERVYRGSPAQRAGLRPGDSIISVNGRRIRSHQDLVRFVNSQRPGDVVELEFVRPVRQSTEARLVASRSTADTSQTARGTRPTTGMVEGDRVYRDGFDARETSRLRADDDRDVDEGLIFDRDRDGRRFEALRPFD